MIDIMYEIKYNETNFTAIKEVIETGVSSYLFQTLFCFFILYWFKIDIERKFEEQLNLIVIKFENKFLLLENDFDKIIMAFSKTCNELVEDPETGEKRFCKNHPKENSGYCYLHEEEGINYSTDEEEEKGCNHMIKGRFCKNFTKKDSIYCNIHDKRYIECHENYKYESEEEEL